MKNHEDGLLVLARSDSKYIIGVDEVGTGAIAGPFVVAAVVMERGWSDSSVKDSKAYKRSGKTTAHQKRQQVVPTITNAAKTFRLRTVSAKTIDEFGVGVALPDALAYVIKECFSFYDDAVIVVDGIVRPVVPGIDPARIICLPKADALIPAVSAASVLAKAHRDEAMLHAASLYPGYGFKNNFGYGTKGHLDGLKKLGLTPLHRRSYGKVSQYSEAK